MKDGLPQPLGLAGHLLQRDRLLVALALAVVCLIAAAWTIIGPGMEMSAIEMTAMSGMADMPGLFAPGAWTIGYAGLVFLMWWLMMIAMMLPSAAPVVLLHAALLRRAGVAASVQQQAAAFTVGYLSVWAGFSLLAALAQWSLEAAGIVSATMMVLKARGFAGALLVAAGIYQLTPLKRACLDHCRDPVGFLTAHRRPGAAGAFVMGLEHGTFCAGCCVFLMALLFVGGIMNLYWIAAIALLVALEKLAPFGGRLSHVVGIALVATGAWLIAATLLAGF